MAKKHQRSTQELAEALVKHVRLLKEYATKAFQENDEAYLGEVSGKLRILVCKGPNNTPLLLTLMDILGLAEVRVTLSGPPLRRTGKEPIPGDQITLRDYMKMRAYGIKTPSHGFVFVSNQEIVALWAQQLGASHEGWELDERLLIARDSGLYVGDRPVLAH